MNRAAITDFALMFALAIGLRTATIGHPNLFIDEAYYLVVADAMHHGAVPYVDIWDRKPFGLFALYWLLTLPSTSPVGYQIAAIAFSGATGWVISRIARYWASRFAALGAGALYILSLGLFQGFGGQSPVFYNLFVAWAAWLLLKGSTNLRLGRIDSKVRLAMLVAGTAITIKTTALFEGVYFGLFALWQMKQSRLPARAMLLGAIGLATIGALPSLAIAGSYAALGHFDAWWQAMVTANLVPGKWDSATALAQAKTMALVLTPFALLAMAGLRRLGSAYRAFMIGWLLAAIIGLVSVPYFHAHYALPLLVPLSAAAAGGFGNPRITTALLAVATFLLAPAYHPTQFDATKRAIFQMTAAAAAIRTHGAERGVFIFQGPPYLYVASGAQPITPLAFPPHLNHAIERNASGLDTARELRRILAGKPGVVVTAAAVRDGPLNNNSAHQVARYVSVHCRLVSQHRVDELLRFDQIIVWGNCR